MRYAAFAGAVYYPRGGFGDFVSWHDNEADAVRSAKLGLAKREEYRGWWEVWCISQDDGNPTLVAEGSSEELS